MYFVLINQLPILLQTKNGGRGRWQTGGNSHSRQPKPSVTRTNEGVEENREDAEEFGDNDAVEDTLEDDGHFVS